MRGYLLVLPIVGACVAPESTIDAISVQYGGAEIYLVGDQINNVYVDANVTGPLRDGSPLTVSDAIVQVNDGTGTKTVATLTLTTGDQAWHPGGAWTYVQSPKVAAPSGLLAYCGYVADIELTVGAEMADDGHVESSSGGAANVIDCA